MLKLKTWIVLVVSAIAFTVEVSWSAEEEVSDPTAKTKSEAYEHQIFAVKKLIAMSTKDPIIHDYYLNAGTVHGVRAGAILPLYRRFPLQDAYRGDTQTQVDFPVGQVKVIYSDKTMSVARPYKLLGPKDFPINDSTSLMIGDRIDLKGISFSEDKGSEGVAIKPKDKKGSANSERKTASVKPKPRKPAAKKQAKVEQLLPQKLPVRISIDKPIPPRSLEPEGPTLIVQ